MQAVSFISVEEYLSRDFEVDCEYIDGELQNRNVGEQDHSIVQYLLQVALTIAAQSAPIRIRPELRLRLKANRYRIPDIVVMRRSQPYEPVLTLPPFLCIEVVSPEDRMSRILEKVEDYLAFGVEYVWVVDPRTAYASQHTRESSQQVKDFLTTRNPNVAISVPKLFEDLRGEQEDELR